MTEKTTEVIKMRNTVLRITVVRDADGNVVRGNAANIISPAKEVIRPDRIVNEGGEHNDG